ncbi:MAG: hypothetical protein ACO1OG_02320 [Devosia sp.]
MSRPAASKTAATSNERVATGDYADVWLFGEALAEWKAVCGRNDENSRRAVTRIGRYLPRFASSGPRAFTEEMFKSVQRIKASGGNEHMIFEFKAHQFRLYGVIVDYKGKRSFVGTACDPAKKNNKADPAILKRAADAADKI